METPPICAPRFALVVAQLASSAPKAAPHLAPTLAAPSSFFALLAQNRYVCCHSRNSVAAWCRRHVCLALQRFSVSPGYYTIPSSGNRTGEVECPVGSYCVDGEQVLCPPGFYGDAPVSSVVALRHLSLNPFLTSVALAFHLCRAKAPCSPAATCAPLATFARRREAVSATAWSAGRWTRFVHRGRLSLNPSTQETSARRCQCHPSGGTPSSRVHRAVGVSKASPRRARQADLAAILACRTRLVPGCATLGTTAHLGRKRRPKSFASQGTFVQGMVWLHPRCRPTVCPSPPPLRARCLLRVARRSPYRTVPCRDVLRRLYWRVRRRLSTVPRGKVPAHHRRRNISGVLALPRAGVVFCWFQRLLAGVARRDRVQRLHSHRWHP